MADNRILFAGTPEISVPLLRALASRFHVAGVLTSCDKPSGRSSVPVPSPVKSAALELGLPVIQFDSLRTEAREAVSSLGADTLVTFAFGRIFGPRFLALFPKGTFNVHPSALPMFRGPSPIQAAISAGLKETAISLQTVGEKMDEGDIWSCLPVILDGTENTQTLTTRVSELAASFVPDVLEDVFAGKKQPIHQQGEASYCSMIAKEDGAIDFSRPASEVHSHIRACFPWPKARTSADGKELMITSVWGTFSENEGLELLPEGTVPGTVLEYRKDRGLAVACADRAVWLSGFQLPGKKEMGHRDFMNGNRWILSAKLGF